MNRSKKTEYNTTPLCQYLKAKKPINHSSPDIFGPPFWFTLHNSSANIKQGILTREYITQVQNFIRAIPSMIPCGACAGHAQDYISSHEHEISQIKTGRDVYMFYFTFHNTVNARLGKPVISLEKSLKLYT